MNEKGNVVEGGDISVALCISQAWQGMARTIYGDQQRFIDAYFRAYSGYYLTRDGVHWTEGGYYLITGRMDDIINIRSHSQRTAEIEDAMADLLVVPETAVIGYHHDIKEEAAFAFIVLKDDNSDANMVVNELKLAVATKIAKYAVPDQILVVKHLPQNQIWESNEEAAEEGQSQQGARSRGYHYPGGPWSVITEILSAFQKYEEQWAATN